MKQADKAIAPLQGYIARFAESSGVQRILSRVRAGEPTAVKGLQGSSYAVLLASLSLAERVSSLVLADGYENASYLYSDLSGLLPADQLYFFPSSFHDAFVPSHQRSEAIIQRNELVSQQGRLLERLAADSEGIVMVSYIQAVGEPFATDAAFAARSLIVRVGDTLSLLNLVDRLHTLGFTEEERVVRPGQYASRGSIVDVFSFIESQPFRIDFLGDEVDTIRVFDVETQLSVRKVTEALCVSSEEQGVTGRDSETLMSFLPRGVVVFGSELSLSLQRYGESVENHRAELPVSFVGVSLLREQLHSRTLVESALRPLAVGSEVVEFRTTPQPLFQKNFSRLADTIRSDADLGYKTYILAEQQSQITRLRDIFTDLSLDARVYEMLELPLREGFVDADQRVNIFTDHQIFDRYHAAKLRKRLSPHDPLSAHELQLMQPGDYVVHIDHGVGVFEGLVREEEGGVVREYVRVGYKDSDTVLVNIHNLGRLSKYRGKDGVAPQINRLGSGRWSRLKERAKGRVKDIARDLIRLYAERRLEKGFAFSADTYLQESLESSFMYQDTPDQITALAAVKRDMESDVPMDRLVCGDVGFGKTEIAVRAAFKAATDGKQVAVLVPTTVLALQHYKTFSSRLEDFPCTVDYLSRLKSAAQQREVRAKLAEGRIDIIIGTHALLRSTVRFKDLGLLIVDEEQKFGVAAKEKLKAMSKNVDTLTLTATPIPRTLQFSLMGARDMSILSTPPPNRYPIATTVSVFDEKLVTHAIREELGRGGQVFFVHNEINKLPRLHAMLVRNMPTLRCAVAHGQMKPSEIETVMLDFMAGDYDVLLCTSIIESGLDIPNANTIIINNGHRFGLSDLHQLRGRVGRTNRKAYCYIFTPPLELLTPEARRRVAAIEEFSELGSGIHISMQDLDIRGAGNLLGAEQSGFIMDLGMETYQRILDEAVRELKYGEFSELFGDEFGLREEWVSSCDCQVETDLDVALTEDFVRSATDRIAIYREIDLLRDATELERFRTSLADRFGRLPERVDHLLSIPPLRWAAAALGVEKLQLRGGRLTLHFVSPGDSPYYGSKTFAMVQKQIARYTHACRVCQMEDHLRVDVEGVDTVQEGLDFLSYLSGAYDKQESVAG